MLRIFWQRYWLSRNQPAKYHIFCKSITYGSGAATATFGTPTALCNIPKFRDKYFFDTMIGYSLSSLSPNITTCDDCIELKIRFKGQSVIF